jgi:hypothetical protein
VPSADTKEVARTGTRPGTLLGLAAILLVYCTLAVFQSHATRLQWGPDEPAHIIYVQSLALDGRLPALAHSTDDGAYIPGAARTHQAQHPPLYYAAAALLWRAFASRPDETVRYVDRTSGETLTFTVPGPVRPVRLLSVFLGALTLVFVWATAWTVFPQAPAVCLAGTALAAFTPMFTYVNSVINNDALLGVAFAASAWQWARIMRFGAAPRDVLFLGLLLGLAMNVKETALSLVLLSGAVLAVEPQGGAWRRRLARIGVVLALVAALGGWWFVRKHLLYGSPFVHPFHAPLLELPSEQRALLLKALPARIFLFAFIPVDAIASHARVDLLFRFFGALSVLSLGGLAVLHLRRRRLQLPGIEVASVLLWVGATALVLAGLWWNLLTVDWRMGTSGGRLLLCALPLLWLAAARGLSALFGDGKAAKLGLAAVVLSVLATNLYALWATAAEYGTLGL